MAGQELQILTELDAVNMSLMAIGESPVSSIEDTGYVDAMIALNTLRNVTRQTCNRGWRWNTLYDYWLLPEVSTGYIALPSGTLKVEPTDEYKQTVDVFIQGTQLYDRKNNTLVFTEGFKANVVQLNDFDTLPSPARDYIAARSAQKFQQALLGTSTPDIGGISVNEAWSTLNTMETENESANVLFDNWSTGKMFINRRR